MIERGPSAVPHFRLEPPAFNPRMKIYISNTWIGPMKKIKSTLLVVLAILMISGASAEAKKVSRTVVVDDSFAEFYIRWDRSGDLYMRYKPLNVNGQLEICAAYSGPSGNHGPLNQALLTEARIVLGGNTMQRNLDFARKISKKHQKAGLIGQPAICVTTGKPFPSGDCRYGVAVRPGKYRVSWGRYGYAVDRVVSKGKHQAALSTCN